jgi:integrase
MRRKRFQRGSLSERKHGRVRVWVAQWWENDSRRSRVIGKCAQVTRSEAETILAGILRPINEGTVPVAMHVFTFGKFVEQVYLPHCRRSWKRSTDSTSGPVIARYLTPVLGDRILTSITRTEMQDLLEAKAPVLCRNVVGHLRWYLNAIFKLAVSDGMVGHNPAAELRIPKHCKPGRYMRSLTEDEVIQYLDALDLQERLIARLAIYEGLRPGEILALRWGSFDDEAINITERVYQGKFDTPKNGKARESGMSDGTIELLRTWRTLARSTSPEAFVFPSENQASPLDMGNLWPRAFRPRLERIGLEWATFQVLRKTNATLGRKYGIDPKVSADQRGHGLGVSMEVYTMSDRQQKREAVNRLEAMVTQKRKLSA